MTDPVELIITCSCSQLDHAVRFTFYPISPGKDELFEAYINVCLDHERSFWGRLQTAWRYLFGKTCNYGNVSEIVIKEQDLSKIQAWVGRAERENVKWKEVSVKQ